MPPHINGSCEVLTGSMKLKTGFVKSESEKFTVKKLLCHIQVHITYLSCSRSFLYLVLCNAKLGMNRA